MKNKLKIIFYICFVSLVSINNAKLSELNFEAKNIDTKNNELIFASDEVIITDKLGNKIFADNLEMIKLNFLFSFLQVLE